MNAKEAKELARVSYQQGATHQLEEILNKVRSHASKGFTRLVLSDVVLHPVRRELTKLGYTYYDNTTFTVISW